MADGHLGEADATEDGGLVPMLLRPGFDGMAGEFIVAVFAGVVLATATHFDGDDVDEFGVVAAAGFGIESDATHWRARGFHTDQGRT